MTAITITDFINATASFHKTGQPRYARQGAEALLALTRSGAFTRDYLIALADGICEGIKHR